METVAVVVEPMTVLIADLIPDMNEVGALDSGLLEFVLAAEVAGLAADATVAEAEALGIGALRS